MTGNRHITGPKKQLPEWMVQNKPYLLDATKPEGKPKKFIITKEFNDPKPARRFANRMEEHNHKTKLIEVTGDLTKKPTHYRVYIRETKKK